MVTFLNRCSIAAILMVCVVCMPRAILGAAEIQNRIDWPQFMARHDLVWNRLPVRWGEGAFTGNGLLGAMVYLTDDHAPPSTQASTRPAEPYTGPSGLRFRIGRSDVMVQERESYRVPIGDLVLVPVGKITGGQMRQDLWNAEVTGTITTDKGQIEFRTYTHANELVQVIELKPSDGERGCRWEFVPGVCANPRDLRNRTPIPDDEKSPDPVASTGGDAHAVLQKVFNGDEYATVWQETPQPDARRLCLSVGYVHKAKGAAGQALSVVAVTSQRSGAELSQSHRAFWHDFYRASFLSVPETRMESFYWIQLYKLASATRADRPAIDLMGPWFNDTPWPRIWWNLNIQLTYYPVYAANHLELGESLCRTIDAGAENLAKNAKEFADDSDTIGRTSGYDCRSPGGNELCDLPWAVWNYYMQYRYSMDVAMLRDRLFPRLKRSINYYFHFLKEGTDGKLHTTKGYSPEYPNQPPSTDVNIDLALIRWGCQSLLDTCARLKIDDPLIPKWKDTLARLAPYPTDETGLKLSNEMSFKVSHRHYSHLLMIYPLYVMNWDQPGNRPLIEKSFDHWTSNTSAFRGYSWTGASSICSSIGRRDDAVRFLDEFLKPEGRYKCLPNTHYAEAGPVIETPLSGARALQDIVLQNWGGTMRVFPGVPDSWKDVTIASMRTEGAFLVSAVKRDGKTRWVRIESLAGEPCRVKTDIADVQASGDVALKTVGEGVVEVALKKGDAVVLFPRGEEPDMVVEPVAAQKDRVNLFGLP